MSENRGNAGWYPDPMKPGSQRYFDGENWTDDYAPLAQATSPEKKQEAEGTDIAGYILAVLFPIVGFIIGLVRLNKSRHGIWIVVVSVIAFVVWLAIIGSSQESSTSGGYYYQ